MLYLSVDIETTGLNPKNCDIVQFACVLDNLKNPLPIEKLPRFQTYFLQKSFHGEPYALSMHPQIFKKIANAMQKRLEIDENNDRYMFIDQLPTALENFLEENNIERDPKTNKFKITIAGKNAAMFDLPFLNEKIHDWGNITFSHRVIDPAILYYQSDDNALPDSKLCMERAGLTGEVSHTALEDALVVVQLIRNKLGWTPTPIKSQIDLTAS